MKLHEYYRFLLTDCSNLQHRCIYRCVLVPIITHVQIYCCIMNEKNATESLNLSPPWAWNSVLMVRNYTSTTESVFRVINHKRSFPLHQRKLGKEVWNERTIYSRHRWNKFGSFRLASSEVSSSIFKGQYLLSAPRNTTLCNLFSFYSHPKSIYHNKRKTVSPLVWVSIKMNKFAWKNQYVFIFVGSGIVSFE